MELPMQALKIHMMHETGTSFIDIAKQFGISAKEAMQDWIKVEKARERAKARERVVYRKRLITDHTKLIEKMRCYNA
ncbi:hypothetical protein POTTS_234 [Klebsiella phage vB_KpnM_Potts1]|uniref:Uncharacterized protein n=4 Tax=Marfavirus F48 TaxID=2845079 RepID=A0A5B9NPA3_9CAUD|nr:hypothetical protein POTTS_234 [Klebsiella phage vB_KpnM_Potts1]